MTHSAILHRMISMSGCGLAEFVHVCVCACVCVYVCAHICDVLVH